MSEQTLSTSETTAAFRPSVRQQAYMVVLVDRLRRGQRAADTHIAPYIGVRPEAISYWRRRIPGFRAWADAELRTRYVAVLVGAPELPPRTRPRRQRRPQAAAARPGASSQSTSTSARGLPITFIERDVMQAPPWRP